MKFTDLLNQTIQLQADIAGTILDGFNSPEIAVCVNDMNYFLPTTGVDADRFAVCRWQVNPAHQAVFQKFLNEKARINFLEKSCANYKAVYYNGYVVLYHNFEMHQLATEYNLTPSDFDYVTVCQVGSQIVLVRIERANRSHKVNCEQTLLRLGKLDPQTPKAYRVAYNLAVGIKKAAQARKRELTILEKITVALEFGGAELISTHKTGTSIQVKYRIPAISSRREFTTVVASDMTVITPGVCFRAGKYDLKSLVPAIRKGYRHGLGDWSRQWHT